MSKVKLLITACKIMCPQKKNAKHYTLMLPISEYGFITTLQVNCQKNFCYLKLDFSCYVNEEYTFIGNAQTLINVNVKGAYQRMSEHLIAKLLFVGYCLCYIVKLEYTLCIILDVADALIWF